MLEEDLGHKVESIQRVICIFRGFYGVCVGGGGCVCLMGPVACTFLYNPALSEARCLLYKEKYSIIRELHGWTVCSWLVPFSIFLFSVFPSENWPGINI
jgi:hypothetical protein